MRQRDLETHGCFSVLLILSPLLLQQNFMLRWKQGHQVQPTAVGDHSEVNQGCGNTPLAFWDWKHTPRCTECAVRVMVVSVFANYELPLAAAESHLEVEARPLVVTHRC